MKITEITYGRTFALGNYCSERIDLTASIDEEKESVIEANNQLRTYCEQLHQKNNPHLYSDNTTTVEFNNENYSPGLEVTDTRSTLQKYSDEMNKCNSKEQLEKEWSLLAKSNKNLKEAYDIKYQELSK